MNQDNKTEEKPVVAPVAVQQRRVFVLQRKSGKNKGKRKYSSKAAKQLDRLHRGGTDAVVRIYDGLSEGAHTYKKKSEKSARKRRDGRVRDALVNWTAAVADAGSEISKAPNDFAKKVNRGRWRVIL